MDNIKRIFINDSLTEDEYSDILKKLPNAKVSVLHGNEKPTPIGYEIEEIIDNGKDTIVIGKSSNQVKYSPSCKAGYCPGFKKITPLTNGCPYSCEYCFLQATYRTLYPFIKINVNTKDLLNEITKDINSTKGKVLYNCGEMLDSLALDHITELSKILIPFFAKQKDAYLLFLTKSANVQNLLNLQHNKHTILSWSINCDEVINKYEHYTASLKERVEAAKICQEHGYPIRFRFDPLILIENWQEKYSQMIEYVLTNVNPEMITIGTLRFAPSVKGISHKRFSGSHLFDYEFTRPLEDGKKRYKLEDRMLIYEHVIKEIRKYNSTTTIGICKEKKEIWDMLKLEYKQVRCNCMI